MACNPNYVATAASWLSLKDSPHQTLRAHMEKNITSGARCQYFGEMMLTI